MVIFRFLFNCATLSNSVAISQTVAEIWQFFDFLTWRPSATLDLCCVHWDYPRKAFWGLYHCAKFGWNWSCSFEDMWISILCDFGLKMPIYAPLWSYWHISPELCLSLFGYLKFHLDWYIRTVPIRGEKSPKNRQRATCNKFSSLGAPVAMHPDHCQIWHEKVKLWCTVLCQILLWSAYIVAMLAEKPPKATKSRYLPNFQN